MVLVSVVVVFFAVFFFFNKTRCYVWWNSLNFTSSYQFINTHKKLFYCFAEHLIENKLTLHNACVHSITYIRIKNEARYYNKNKLRSSIKFKFIQSSLLPKIVFFSILFFFISFFFHKHTNIDNTQPITRLYGRGIYIVGEHTQQHLNSSYRFELFL